MIAFEKFGQHQPLNRQAERYAREGVVISLSTMADQVGACCAVLEPIFKCLEAHVFAAERLHGDDTTVPVLAKGKTDIARSWVYVRDDRPFAGHAPPAAVFYYSRDRGGAHPQGHLATYAGILQADAFGGYKRLYDPARQPGPITEAACWAHARRKFFILADLALNAKRKAQGKTPVFMSPWRWRPCAELTRCSMSNARSTAAYRRNGGRSAKRSASRSSSSWRLGCAVSAPSSRATMTSPKPSTTCSSVGHPSRASLRTGESASRTTRQSAG
jgi:hypothetical protein